jgi:hypothetical protein
MARVKIPETEKAKSSGISLPPDLLKRLRKRAFDLEVSKSRLAQDIFNAYFKRVRYKIKNGVSQ